jgi:hypothetical protein
VQFLHSIAFGQFFEVSLQFAKGEVCQQKRTGISVLRRVWVPSSATAVCDDVIAETNGTRNYQKEATVR